MPQESVTMSENRHSPFNVYSEKCINNTSFTPGLSLRGNQVFKITNITDYHRTKVVVEFEWRA